MYFKIFVDEDVENVSNLYAAWMATQIQNPNFAINDIKPAVGNHKVYIFVRYSIKIPIPTS